MSIKALAWAWDYETTDPLEKLILLCVADHVNESMGNQAWPSVERLCKLCGCSRSTALRKLKQLEEKNIIQRQKRFNKTDIVVFNFNASQSRSQSDTCHTDTPKDGLEVSQRHTNPYSNLTLTTISEKRFQSNFKKVNQSKTRELSEKQKAFAHSLATRLWDKHKQDGFSFQPILDDVESYLKGPQTPESWLALGNGLPNPLGH